MAEADAHGLSAGGAGLGSARNGDGGVGRSGEEGAEFCRCGHAVLRDDGVLRGGGIGVRGGAGPGGRFRIVEGFGVLVAVDGGEHPVRHREVVDGVCQEVVGHRPFGGLAVGPADEGAVAWQVLDEHRESAGGEPAAVPVEQVDAIVAECFRASYLASLRDIFEM